MKDEDNKINNEELIESASEEDSEILEFEYNEDPEGKQASYGAGGEEELVKKVLKLKAELKQARKEKEEYLVGWQKERADFMNYKKQEEDRKSMFSESMRERILSRFLIVLDSFNMAFQNKSAWEKVDESWRKGIEYIFAQMNTVFEEYGVKPIGVVGERFDPNFHQSIDMVETKEKEQDHTVASVVQTGYVLGERVLREAKVNVYEYKE